MTLTGCDGAISHRAREVNKAYLVVGAGGPRETRNADCDVGFGSVQRPSRHRVSDLRADDAKSLYVINADAEQVRFRLVGIGDETAVEAMAEAFLISEERGEQPARAAFCGGKRELATPHLTENTHGLLGKRRGFIRKMTVVLG